LVDVNIVLETLRSSDTQVGEWVNVVGYVNGPRSESKPKSMAIDQSKPVEIQAIMLWSAGALNLTEYEQVVGGMALNREA
jgi:hypothetical protein